MMCISGIYALTNATTTGKSFSTSGVNIEIEEYTLNSANEEVKYIETGDITVALGEEVPLIAKINNLGANCYVRVKAVLQNGNTDISNNIKGITSDWQKQGEYYYYKNEVSSKQKIEIFNSIQMPNEMINGDADVKLKLRAEAVQANNFEQDLTKEEPWNGVEIAKCVDNSYTIDDDNNTDKMTIKYENDSNKDIKVADDFFEKLSGLMPGDKKKQEIQIKNTNENKAKYELSLETEELTDKQQDLLSKLSLKITNNKGATIYEGSLINAKGLLLGEYDSNEEDTLNIEINVPSNLGNEYATLKPIMTWKFTANYEDNSDNGNNNNNNNKDENKQQDDKKQDNTQNNNQNTTSKTEESVVKKQNPKTGDSNFDLSLTLFFISTTGLIAILVLEYREKRIRKNKFYINQK